MGRRSAAVDGNQDLDQTTERIHARRDIARYPTEVVPRSTTGGVQTPVNIQRLTERRGDGEGEKRVGAYTDAFLRPRQDMGTTKQDGAGLEEKVVHLVIAHGRREERRWSGDHVVEPAVAETRGGQLELDSRVANGPRGEWWYATGRPPRADTRCEDRRVSGSSSRSDDVHVCRQEGGPRRGVEAAVERGLRGLRCMSAKGDPRAQRQRRELGERGHDL